MAVPPPETSDATPEPSAGADSDDTLNRLPLFGRLGVVSLGLGLLSVLILCVPVVGYVSPALSGLGLLLGLGALVDYLRGRPGGLRFRTTTGAQVMDGAGGQALHYSLAGTAVSLLALALALLPVLLHR
jgi:hypothetical protein